MLGQPHQAPRRGALRQRHRAGDAGAEALEGRGVGGHPADDRQPEAGVHPAVLHHGAAGDGRQRRRGPALRRHRHAGEVLAGVEEDPRTSRSRSIARCPAVLARSGCWRSIHDFMVFDAGVKKSAATTSTSASRRRRRGSPSARAASSGTPRARASRLTMVWLAKWIREHQPDARAADHRPHRARRADREGLQGRQRAIYRTSSGADLLDTLNKSDRVADLLAGPQVPRLRGRGGS